MGDAQDSHPLDNHAPCPRLDKTYRAANVRLRFQNPVVTRDAGIQDPLLDVACHFLGADQKTLDLLVVNDQDCAQGLSPDLRRG
jgi:hypothetical protein